MSLYQFVEEFVKSVLYKIYGTVDYFNIEAIVDTSYPLIEGRIKEINDLLQPISRSDDLYGELRKLDIAKLFPVLLIPTDMGEIKRSSLNEDYNFLILRWMDDPDSFAPTPL